jgi:hypothetical protein
MKKILFLLLFPMVPLVSHAQESTHTPLIFAPEMLGQIGKEDAGSIHQFDISMFASTSLSKKHPVLGLATFMLLSTQGSDTTLWAEGMLGPRLRLLKGSIEAGCLFGAEYFQSYDATTRSVSDNVGFRYSPYLTVSTSNERFFSLVVFEFGKEFTPGVRNQAFRAEVWYTVTNPEKKTRLRMGAFGHGDYLGPAARVQIRFMYIFVAPYMWNTNLSNESVDPKHTFLSTLGLGIELARQ